MRIKHPIILSIVLCVLVTNIASSQSLFREVDKKDEFGDVIGKELVNITEGKFSNSATNNSKLLVKVVYEKSQIITRKQLIEKLSTMKRFSNYSEKEKKEYLKKYGDSDLRNTNSISGRLKFYLFEYERNQVIFNREKINMSVKLSDGRKLRSTFDILKSITLKGIRNNIDRSQIQVSINPEKEKIYNAIVNSKNHVDIVIQTQNSIYEFRLNPIGQ